MKRVIKVLLLFFVVNSLHAEIIPSIQVIYFAVDLAFTFPDDRTIMKRTWQEACLARNLEPTKIPNGWWCDAPGGRTIYTQPGEICIDGSFKFPPGAGMCSIPVAECPNDGWTLSEDKSTCYRDDDACWSDINHVSEVKLLAAIVYGESHASEIYEEMAGIASAVIRRRDAEGLATVNQLAHKRKNYAHVIRNGNVRFKKLMCGDEKDFQKAYDAAENALHYGVDYSNGGCFWDGYDLKRDGKKHDKYIAGFHYSDPSHNIFPTPQPPPKKRKGRKKNGKFLEYNYTYVSTSAKGRTIFWKADEQFLFATGAPQCR